MTPVTLTLELPEELAQEASELGLLRSETLLRAEVDQQVMKLVNAEIQDYRSNKATTKLHSPYK
ncbi:MAG: hypothetical protein LCI00_11345 [Chloroflexi bacterium]|nr:hypothetical protein [Chloroflexota bacterium]MCC6896175.1 hypothetical protein [Anaerolineae bacterium]